MGQKIYTVSLGKWCSSIAKRKRAIQHLEDESDDGESIDLCDELRKGCVFRVLRDFGTKKCDC